MAWRAAIAGSKKIQKYPTTMKVYFPDGNAPQPGDIFRNRRFALGCSGSWSKPRKPRRARVATRRCRPRAIASTKATSPETMGEFSEQNGGLFRYEDFAAYTAKVETPVSVNYRGYEVYKNPSSSQGPAELFLLNILEGYDVKKLGHNSPEYIHTSVEALKLAFADREKFWATPTSSRFPTRACSPRPTRAERRKLIDPDHASLEIRPGNPEQFMKTSQPPTRPCTPHARGRGRLSEGDTSYIAVVDKDHNMVSFEPSLHSGFGTGVVMADLGFIFNCRGDYYSLTPGEPRARTRQAAAEHAAEHAGDEGRPTLVDHRQPRRRRSDHADRPDAHEHDRLRHERSAGDRSSAVVDAQLRVFGVSAHDVSRRSVGRVAHSGGGQDRARRPRPQDPRHRAVDPGIDRRDRCRRRTSIVSAGADPRVDAYAWAW